MGGEPPLRTFRGNTLETHSTYLCAGLPRVPSLPWTDGRVQYTQHTTQHTHVRSWNWQRGSPPFFARLLRPRALKKTYPSDGVVMALMGPPDADPEWLSRSPRAESCHPTGLTENGIVCPAPNDCSRRLLLCGKKRLPRSSCPLRRLPPDRSPMKEAPPGREDEDEDEEDPEPDRGRRRPPDGAGGGSQKQRSCAPPWKGDRAGSKRFRVHVPGRSELDAESEG